MRTTELLAADVVDERGRRVGQVRDVRISLPSYELAGVAVADGWRARLAHRWGFAEGRTQGPWLFRALLRPAVRKTLFVPASRVTEWGPGVVRITGSAEDLPGLVEELDLDEG